MARRANQTFSTWAGGEGPQRFHRDDVIPDDIADKVLALTYDDGEDTPKPRKKRAAKRAASSD